MYTECPGCHTYFKVTPAQLKIAEGKVRCGNCNEVFNAIGSLVEVVPPLASSSQSSSDKDQPASEMFSTPVDVMEQQSTISDDKQIDEGDMPMSAIEPESPEAEQEASLALMEEEPQTMAIQSQQTEAEEASDDLGAINKDIDEALDDLFSEGDLKSEGVASEISAMGDSNSSVIGMFDEPEAAEAKKSETVEEQSFSEIDFDEAKSTPVNKKEPESDALKSSKTSDLTEPSDFDLGDSFLESQSVEMDTEEWESKDQVAPEQQKSRASENYVLEELQESTGGQSSGVLAKIGWILLILVLLLFLVTQFAYLKREELAKYASVRPALEVMCGVLSNVMKCDVPDPRDVSAIDFLDRNVVTHPNAKNALLITSVIKSSAEFKQAFPELELTFSDINQKVIARRTFIPEEYLPKEVNIAAGMKPGVPVKIMLEIVDPGEEAVNFEFDFK